MGTKDYGTTWEGFLEETALNGHLPDQKELVIL